MRPVDGAIAEYGAGAGVAGAEADVPAAGLPIAGAGALAAISEGFAVVGVADASEAFAANAAAGLIGSSAGTLVAGALAVISEGVAVVGGSAADTADVLEGFAAYAAAGFTGGQSRHTAASGVFSRKRLITHCAAATCPVLSSCKRYMPFASRTLN